MNGKLEGLARRYVAALERYLDEGGEAALSAAYELGRQALGEGLGVLDMAAIHQQALGVLVLPSDRSVRGARAEAAGGFFAELLSPFEMSFRGYREANDELRRVNESLVLQKKADRKSVV